MSGTRFLSPSTDELEVSVFGPGKGECIVIHVPGGNWIVVDSHTVKTSTGRAPVAVEYLKHLRVTELFGVFITHWHDDHTRGAADLIRAFSGTLRYVGLPGGWASRELASFVADLLPDQRRFKIVEDLAQVVSALDEPALARVHRAVLSDRVTFRISPEAMLEAFSPSLDDLRHQAATMAQYLPGWTGPPPRRFDVNSGCAVLRLSCGPMAAMLYSDLDVGNGPQRGLQCIVANYSTQLKADVIKIGHHGSETAYYPPALHAGGAAAAAGAITPFPARGEPLPRRKHLELYKGALRTLHVTARPGPPVARNAGKLALKDTPFSGYAKVSPTHLDAVGQVRYRMRATDATPRIETFAGASAP